MAGKREEAVDEQDDQRALIPVLAQLKGLSKTQVTQLVGLEELQRTLDEDIAGVLHRLEQRPVVDVETITQRLDATIDAVDRVTQSRLPRLVARRWWLCWLWMGTGVVLGILAAYWTLATPTGRQALSLVWPAGWTQQAVPAAKKR